MRGVISGGWGYVAAAWGIGFGILMVYVLSIWNRARRATQMEQRGNDE
ncbi:MAG: hypothetical protein H6707_09345 [Deltaproteobacteria bacterium]|nr:hypothetical protein [Deltaproteobacteria bacterium]